MPNSSPEPGPLPGAMVQPALCLSGGQALVPAAEDVVLLVEDGELTMFMVAGAGRGKDDVPDARHCARQPLLNLGPGDGVLLPAAGSPVALLAVATVASRVRAFGPEALTATAAARPNDLAAAVDRGLVRFLEAVAPPPAERRAIDLGPDQKVALPDGSTARSGQGVVWLRVDGGRLLAPVWADGPISEGEPAFPVTPWAPVIAAGPAQVETLTTAALAVRGGLITALAHLQQRLAVVLVRHVAALTDAAERDAVLRRNREGSLMAGALAELSALLADSGGSGRTGGNDDAVLNACRLAAEPLGCPVVAPAGSLPAVTALAGSEAARAEMEQRLFAIADASQFRLRRICLSGRWWEGDCGPLLGYLDGDRLVALVPRRGRSYRLVDPIGDTATPVEPALAARISPAAYQLYRPFGPGPLRARNVFAFAIRPVRQDLLLLLVVSQLAALLSLAGPFATSVLFDRIVPATAVDELIQVTAGLVASAMGMATFELVRRLTILRLESRMNSDVEAAVWDRLLRLPAAFFRGYGAGDLAMRAGAVSQMRAAVGGTTLSVLIGGVFSATNFIVLLSLSGTMAAAALAIVLVQGSLILAANLAGLRWERKGQDQRGRLLGLVLQLIQGVPKLRVAGAELRAFDQWAHAYVSTRRIQQRNVRTAVALATMNSAAGILGLLAVFAMVGFAVVPLPPGAFVAFSTAFGQFLGGTLAIAAVLPKALTALPLYERARPILVAAAEDHSRRSDPGRLRGQVEMTAVTFRYAADGPAVLDRVSLAAEPGQFVALVGPSGSGKSTVLRLLAGFEAPESGTILYDGADLARLDLRAVRRQIGFVLQSGQLMAGTIFEAIAGAAAVPLDQVWDAAHAAGLADDIRRLPMGMYTLIGERGGTLSGGQRQRLLIARALVHRPRILMFDEATSALDNQTQAQVARAMERLNATRIVIAHRLSTIRDADRIYVINEGRVVESGRHDELAADGRLFAQLIKRQIT
ncbi:MAG: NHLP bacteriocin export ABC transporter permease/ATPase subunit [Azospirillum sp.]|nr:NHLP bacteriocin export ABC transporter permease/ATPase subunit [Azospirillum sp.]